MGTVNASFGSGDILLWMLEFLLFVIWFYLLVVIFCDVLRDPDASGGAKAFWTILVVVLPYLGILIHLIARAKGMAARSAKQSHAAQEQLDVRIRATAGATSWPSERVATAKALLDARSVTQVEFDQLKAKALA